jgi:hypothetical protein
MLRHLRLAAGIVAAFVCIIAAIGIASTLVVAGLETLAR